MLLATGSVTSTVIVGVDSKITCGEKRRGQLCSIIMVQEPLMRRSVIKPN
jgi:hypothetical protein